MRVAKIQNFGFYERIRKDQMLKSLIVSLFVVLLAFTMPPSFAQTQISDKVVVLHTISGDMVIELFESDAPKTVSNFITLSENSFYDGTIFHRIIKNFMIQGGDPNTKDTTKVSQWGFGGTGKTIPAELNTIMHKRGIVSMARGDDPDSASSQFFIVHDDSPFLDQKYTVFGRLATQESYDTLDAIADLETTGQSTNYLPTDLASATIQKVEVEERSKIKNLLIQDEPQRVAPPIVETVKPYSNDNLGISFDTLSTWTVQEIKKQDTRQPDIAIIGPDDGVFAPRVLIFIKNSTLTSLEAFSEETKKSYSELIKSGSLVITSEQKSSINGNQAMIRESNQKADASSGMPDLRYQETIFTGNDKFYTITYASTTENFDKFLPVYNQAVNSLKIKDAKPIEKSGCLIATAAFGTELAPQVQTLREIRDNILFGTGSGTVFMAGFNEFYYAFSPTIADFERANPMFKEMVKTTITPMLSTLSILQFVDIDSESKMMGYGIGIILLNVGIYFIAPAIVIIKVRKYLKL